MIQNTTTKFTLSLLFALSFITSANAQTFNKPDFGSQFWKLWGDGKAELAGYDLTYSRYGQLRKGTAVSIFVTENFSNSLRVKADPGKHPKSDVYPVIKLNLIQDFPTGLYDYNVMTSSFIRASGSGGNPIKVSFSAQEWCGHAYAHLKFHKSAIDLTSHSYFDGEADQQIKLPYPPNGISEDALFHWARGLASPVLGPGQSIKIKLLRSLAHSRLKHQPLKWVNATLQFSANPEKITVPAGTFEVDLLTCKLADGFAWKFYVDRHNAYRRIIQWETRAGDKGTLIKSKRLPYWRLHDNGHETLLAEIGLKPRGKRMP